MLLPTVKGRPVLLPAHNDNELGQPVVHYHVDPRFHKGDKPLIIAEEGQEIVYQEFEEQDNEPSVEFGVGIYLQLLSLYEGCKLRGTRCPHKGIEVFHHGQCQGHGLRFDDSGIVLGTIAESYLRLKGTTSTSNPGNFDAVKVKERAVQVREVELVYRDTVLARSKVGPVGANKGDYIRFAFTIGDSIEKRVDPSVNGSCLPESLRHLESNDNVRRTDRVSLDTYCPIQSTEQQSD